MMEGVIKKERDIAIRMEGFGVMFTARSITVPESLEDRRCYEAVISIRSETEPVFQGKCDLCIERKQRNVVGQILDRTFVICVADETIRKNLFGSTLSILHVGEVLNGPSIRQRYLAELSARKVDDPD